MGVTANATEPVSTIAVRNPFNGELVGSVPRASAAEVPRVVAAARTRTPLSPEERSEILSAAADALGARREQFAQLITSEAGVCVKESLKEVDRARGNLLTAAEEAKRIHGQALQIAGARGRRIALTMREPVGVVGAITPFNRPLNQVVVKVAPAIAAGNGVVVKPSEKTPLSALAFAQLMSDCGLPPDTLAIVTGDPDEVGAALVAAVDMVTFTGSVAVGDVVAGAAAGKKITLELGGNDPLIVLEDADLHLAARLAADQAFATAGQSCRGVKRVIVTDSVADELVALLVDETAKKRWGDPFDSATEIGPLIDEAAAKRVQARCVRAVGDGAVLMHGGERVGALYSPTVLDHVPFATELVVQETFGPVAPVLRVADDEEALSLANSTDYGLQAGVVTASFERFMSIAQRLEVGAVNLNEGPAFDSPHIPFGGVKRSGLGREGIRWAIEEMTTLKTITLPRPWP